MLSANALAIIADHSKMETDELTQEAFDKLRERVQVLEELIFVEMKLTADRTDISACQKVEKIKAFIEQVREEEEEDEEVTPTEEKLIKDPAEAGDSIKGNVDPKLQENVHNLKRPAPAEADADESPEAKAARSVGQLKRKIEESENEKREESNVEEKEREKNINSSHALGGYFVHFNDPCTMGSAHNGHPS